MPGRGRRFALPALAVAVALLAGAGAVYYLDAPPDDSPRTGGSATGRTRPTAPAPTTAAPADAYLPGYAKAELTAPDSGYEFDLTAGKVVSAETAAWYLARDGRAFVPSEESDSFVADAGELTVAACLDGIGTRPAAALPFNELARDRPFCVRGPDGNEIAIARLVEASPDGSVTILVDQYRRS